MAEGKKSFILYADLIHTVKRMPHDKAGALFKTILEYVNDENPIVDDLLIEIAFEPIKQQLKRDLKDWEEVKIFKSESGRKGGIKSGETRRKQNKAKRSSASNNEAEVSNPSKNEANEAVNVTVTVNDTVIKNSNTVDERYQKLYEMFYRVSKWDANKISEQVGKFINKYPEVPLNQSGPLVNSWVSNYREVSTTKRFQQ